MAVAALAWLAASCLLTAGCAKTRKPTEVVIEIRADEQVREWMHKLRLVVSSAQGDLSCSEQDCWVTRLENKFPNDQLSWPLQFPVLPLNEDDARVFEIIVQALDRAGNVLVEQRAVSGFAPGRSARISLSLEDLCIDLAGTCAANADCHGPLCGVCVAGECEPAGVWKADEAGKLERTHVDGGTPLPEAGTDQDGEAAERDGQAQAEQDGQAQTVRDGQAQTEQDGQAQAEQDGQAQAEQDGQAQAEGGTDASLNAGESDAACVPKSCAQLAAACGENVPDGCGGTLASCGAGSCAASGPRYACAEDRSGCECVPRSSSEVCQGKLCGSYDDGCGTLIPCGACSGSRSCQTSGDSASCQCDLGSAAKAAACGAASCGNVTTSDGCVYGCGPACATTCSSGGACGAGRNCACPLGGAGADDDEICTAGTCCNPKTAAEACGSQDCGSASDGCGGTLNCGTNAGACAAGSGCADPTYNIDSAVPRCIPQDHANLLGKYLVRAHSFRQSGSGTSATSTKAEAVSIVTIQRTGGALRLRERGCVAGERGVGSLSATAVAVASLATSFFKLPELVVNVVAGAGSAAGVGHWQRPYYTAPLGFINERPNNYFCDGAGSAAPTSSNAPDFDAVSFDQAAVVTPSSGAQKPWLAAPGVCTCPAANGYAALPARNLGAATLVTDCRINDIDADAKPGFSVLAIATGAATITASYASLSTVKWWGTIAANGSHYGFSAISDDRAAKAATQWLSCQGTSFVCPLLAGTADWGCGSSFNVLRFTRLAGSDLQLGCGSFYPAIPVTSVNGVNQNEINARFGPVAGSACTVGSNEGCREDEICRAGAGSVPAVCVPMTTPGACTGTGTTCRAGWACAGFDGSCWPASCAAP